MSDASKRTTRGQRLGSPLRWLRADEVSFIDAAFRCVLPDVGVERVGVSPSSYVDAKLTAPSRQTSDAESSLDVRLYRSGIADVQALCERTFGRRFQSLAVEQQLAALAHLERPEGVASGLQRYLLDLLLNDAAEMYFDVASSSRPKRPETRCAANV